MKKLKARLNFKANCFVLTVGDEGGILIYLKEGKVERRLFALNSDPENTREFDKLMASDETAPVYLLVDMMDQTYVQQTLPPVSALSVDSLIKKRLDRDFAPEDIKGAIRLGRDKQGRKDWYFMLIALASTPQLQAWFQLAINRANHFAGIYLAPVESYVLLDRISRHICAEEKRSPSTWQLIVIHSKVGGFRQVVFKNGKILFTRLTQPIGELVPEVVAGNIEQEALNTIEYLKRLSYQEGNDSLDAYVIVSQEIKASLDPKNIKATNVSLLTPFEVAEMLQMEHAALPGDSFGDVVLATSFGLSRKHFLRLKTNTTKKLEKLQGYRYLLRAAAVAAMISALGFSIYTLFGIIPMQEEISLLEQTKVQLRGDMNKLEMEANKLPDKLENMIDVLNIYETAFKPSADPLKMVARISETLVNGVLVQNLEWSAQDTIQAAPVVATNPDGTPAASKPEVTAVMDLEFANKFSQSDEFVKKATDYLKSLREKFYDYDVANAKLPGTLNADETLQTSLGEPAATNTIFQEGQPIIVNVTLSGPKQVDANANPAAAGAAPSPPSP